MNKQYSGRYIVLEGPEGVGKTTQLELLSSNLQTAGYSVKLFREPDSQTDLTARNIRMMTQDPRYPMNTRTEVLLYNAARSQSLESIRKARQQGIICLCDRNYLTTLAIQYYGRGDVKDYGTITNIIRFAVNDMEPDMTIVLDAPVPILKDRALSRGAGERFDNLDVSFLERVRSGYLWEANERKFPIVDASGTPDAVFNNIWRIITGQVQQKSAPAASPPPVSISESITPVGEVIAKKKQSLAKANHENIPTDNPAPTDNYLKKDKKGNYKITEAGKKFLSGIVTNTDTDVYAFTNKLSATTIAAAMARLSRRGDDMRITLLDEFSKDLDKDSQLLQRVITAYGDDSVQQLVGQHIVVENASNLLTKKLEWGRLASYLEQSTRYIYYDQKDSQGRYKYLMPKHLPKNVKQKYKSCLDSIFSSYSDMASKLTDYILSTSKVPSSERDGAFNSAVKAQACDAVRAVLPVATKSTVGIFASGQALENMVMNLLSDDLPEARATGQAILDESRKVIPVFLERADKPDRGGATIAYRSNTFKKVQGIVESQLSNKLGQLDDEVQLVDFWPKNELDLLPHMLYEHSSLSLNDIQNELRSWTYDQKIQAFKAYIGERLNRRHRPGRALEVAHYSWDLICDYGIFRDLQRHRIVDSLEWQELTPRYGFEIPEIVEKAGLAEQYESCFDQSAELFSFMQSAGYPLEAQYATLLGHKMRWKVTYNAREAFHLHELRTAPQGHPGYRKLVKQMHDKFAEAHPILAESMTFINKDEDEELTRLAAERATQYKLSQLDQSQPSPK